MDVLPASAPPEVRSFRHEALLYEGPVGFVDSVLPFLREGVERDEAMLVVVDAAKIDLVRAGLGPDADTVRFVDMAAVGGNPSRIIPAWRAFVEEAGDRPSRGVGEPVWPGRSPDEMDECHLHESLLNVAFADGRPFWLVCPYDTTALDPDVIAAAGRTHPFMVASGQSSASRGYPGLEGAARGFRSSLAEPVGLVEMIPFDLRSLRALRIFVRVRAISAGVPEQRTTDLVIAANEIATNSLRHGGGSGMLRTWTDERSFVCEVTDSGTIDDPLVGRGAPSPGDSSGRGLWMANELCDLVQVRSAEGSAVVRLHMRIPPAGDR